MNKKQILIEGKILNYYENLLGEKEGVFVFLHGWMQDGKSFELIFQILEKKKIPYISLDLPGFGGSVLWSDDMDIQDYSNCVIGCIQKLGLTHPNIIGHSFGGKTTINIANSYKDINKIVLICSAGIKKEVSYSRYLIVKTAKTILSLPGLSGIGKKVKHGFSSPDFKNAGKMEKIFRNAIAQDYKAKMQKINTPVLLIWGDQDDQTPVSDAKSIHQHIKNSKLQVFHGSHFVHQEKPKDITELILNFIKK